MVKKVSNVSLRPHQSSIKQDLTRPLGTIQNRANKDDGWRIDIHNTLKTGAIEPAKKKWGATIVLALNKHGSLRFCLHHRKLNAVMVCESYSVWRRDKCIDSLGDDLIFSALNATQGYWMVRIDDATRDKQPFLRFISRTGSPGGLLDCIYPGRGESRYNKSKELGSGLGCFDTMSISGSAQVYSTYRPPRVEVGLLTPKFDPTICTLETFEICVRV